MRLLLPWILSLLFLCTSFIWSMNSLPVIHHFLSTLLKFHDLPLLSTLQIQDHLSWSSSVHSDYHLSSILNLFGVYPYASEHVDGRSCRISLCYGSTFLKSNWDWTVNIHRLPLAPNYWYQEPCERPHPLCFLMLLCEFLLHPHIFSGFIIKILSWWCYCLLL